MTRAQYVCVHLIHGFESGTQYYIQGRVYFSNLLFKLDSRQMKHKYKRNEIKAKPNRYHCAIHALSQALNISICRPKILLAFLNTSSII